jgi:peptidoglycan/xylan/chitin deacetylase (PgdA/CDA1 family)
MLVRVVTRIRQRTAGRGRRAGLARLARPCTLAALGLLAVVLASGAPGPAARASSAGLAHPAQAAKTVVTFTWGGGFANQMGALPVFRQYGMHATFYVPSGLVCVPATDPGCASMPYLRLTQVRQIAAAGDEIGGLSVEHVPLAGLPVAEAEREICDDRVNLTRWGFRVTDFAYPFALVNPALQALARRCGYNSGLGTGQLRGAGKCTTCAWAETIPPANPFVLRTPIEVASVGTSWTPATFEQIVDGARRHGGGWIIFTVHDVCAKNCSLGVTLPELTSVLRWLSRQQGHGVSVQTVAQVVGGPVHPAVAGPQPRMIPPPGVINSRLSQAAAGGVPACFQTARYGTNKASFRYRAGAGPGGTGAEFITLSQWQSGTAQLLPTLDLGACAPSVQAGDSYTAGAWYHSSQPVVFNLYYRTPVGTWKFWTTSPAMPASAKWTRVSWATPDVPSGATGLSFGLALSSNGTVATSGYSLTPAGRTTSTWLIALIGGAAVLAVCAVIGAVVVRRRRRAASGQ